MFTPLSINHTFNTCTATNHLFDIPQKQTTHYGTYSITLTVSVTWNDLVWNTSQNVVDCKISEFKRTIFQTFLAKNNNNTVIAPKLQQNLSPVHYLIITTSVMHHVFSFFSLPPLLFFLFSYFHLLYFLQVSCCCIICLLSRSIMNAY